MRQSRLPDGFGVRLDSRVHAYEGGRVLIGGSPTRVVRLASEAAALIGDGFLEVTDPKSAEVARRLLDSGIANPRPRLLPSMNDVTVIVVLRNDEAGLARILRMLRGHNVVVVDRGSDRPVRVPQQRGGRCRVTVVRLDGRYGAAAAHNVALRAVTTEYIAFLDPDVVPRSGWLEVMLGHFSDPAVALVAPRVVAFDAVDADATVVARFERSRSVRDLGRREAAVNAEGPVRFVTGSAVLLRRRALDAVGGFPETLSGVGMGAGAADIEMCWRLEQAGWRLRYEPAAHVAYENQRSMRTWLKRSADHGANAAALACRYRRRMAPLVISRPTVSALALLATATWSGAAGMTLPFALAVLRARRRFLGVDCPTRAAALYAAQGFGTGLWQVTGTLFRHYWPLTLLAVLGSRRIRAVVVALALAEGIVDWGTHRTHGGLDPVRYVLLKRLHDGAYGYGLWCGILRTRRICALIPTLEQM